MKILLISSLLPKEEGENILSTSYALADLANQWHEQGAEVEVMRPIWIPSEAIGLGSGRFRYKDILITTFPIIRVPKIFRYSTGPLIGYLKKEGIRPQIIIAHMSHSIRMGTKISKKMGLPLLSGLHGGDLQLIKEKPGFLLPFLRKSQAIWTRSLASKNQLRSYSDEDFGEVGDCFSGIEREELLDFPLAKNKFEGEEAKPLRFISACTLIPLKNLDIVIEGLSDLKDIDFSYSIYGEGPEKDRLQGIIKKFELEGRISIFPFITREELLEKMKEAHFYLMPSTGETFGLSFVEAAAKGCIILGLQGHGVDGIFKDEEEAIMLKDPSPQDLRNRIATLIKNPHSLKKMLEKSLAKVSTLENSILAKQQLDFMEKTIGRWRDR